MVKVMNSAMRDADIGKRLRQIRKANGLSQRELAKKSGVTNSNISMIEQGQVSPSIQSLAKVLAGIPMSLAQFFTCSERSEQEVFFTKDRLSKREMPYGFIQILGEANLQKKITLQNMFFSAESDTGLSPQVSFVDQAGWVTEGSLQISIGAKTQLLKAGEGFYLRAYEPYRITNASADEDAMLLLASLLAETKSE